MRTVPLGDCSTTGCSLMCLAGVVEGSLARGYRTWSRRARSARVGPSQKWTFPSEQQVHTTAKVDERRGGSSGTPPPMAATVGSVLDWLPPILEAELGLSAEQAQQAANNLAKSLFKPSGTKLLRELEHEDHSRWTELMGTLANYVVSLTGGDVG
eukprot:7333535-Prymnesium_polylepis.1